MNNLDPLINRDNYLYTREFLDYLLNVKNRNKKSVERYQFWLRHLLLWAMERSFAVAHKIKPSFPQYVNELGLAAESRKKIVETARSFFKWVKLYHSHPFGQLPAYWIEDLTPPKVPRGNNLEYVTVEEALKIVRLKIDRDNIALWRDQAMTAMLFLSGARAGAATSLPIKAVHLDSKYPNIEQKPALGVHTKNNQSATTFLHNIPELLETARGWDAYVRSNCPQDYPWYAPVLQRWGEQSLADILPGNNRITALNHRLNILDQAAGLPHRSPHKYRHGYAIYGLQHCQTMAHYHALSRNLMHANIAITDEHYVHIEEMERGKLLDQVSQNHSQSLEDELNVMLAKLDREDLHRAITIAAGLLVKQ